MSVLPVVAGLGMGIVTFATVSSLQGRNFVEYGLSGYRTGAVRKGALSFGVGLITCLALTPSAERPESSPTTSTSMPVAYTN